MAADAIPSIEASVDLTQPSASVSERYYTHYYFIPKYQLLRPRPAHTTPQETSTAGLPMATSPNNTEADVAKPSCKDARAHHDDGADGDQDKPNKKRKLSSSEQYPDDSAGCADDSAGCADDSAGCADEEISERLRATASLQEAEAPEYRLSGEETLVMAHSNKLCLVSLSPLHPIVRRGLTVTEVQFSWEGVDRLANKVSGKSKRGAQVMGSKATLCRLHTAEGTFDVMCGARGRLLQVNSRLISNPDLCRQRHGREGFLAVVLPSLQEYAALEQALVPAQRYEAMWALWQRRKGL